MPTGRLNTLHSASSINLFSSKQHKAARAQLLREGRPLLGRQVGVQVVGNQWRGYLASKALFRQLSLHGWGQHLLNKQRRRAPWAVG